MTNTSGNINETMVYVPMVKATQSTVQPVPTRHRRLACIKMPTALPANTKTQCCFNVGPAPLAVGQY